MELKHMNIVFGMQILYSRLIEIIRILFIMNWIYF